MRKFLPVLALVLVSGAPAGAEVVRVDVAVRGDVGTTGYEKIAGTVHFAVDPAHARNAVVVDLDRAPRNARGRVEFSADLYILRPKAAAADGAAIVEVVNRGRKLMLNGFNRGGSSDPSSDADLGDRFLLKHGLTLVWVGWQFDVAAQPPGGSMRLNAPRANGVETVVRAAFTPNGRDPETTVTDLAGYAPIVDNDPQATLTVRDGPFGAPAVVPRSSWRLRGHVVALPAGFEPGRTYEVAYRTADPPVAGLGLAAVRDVASWLKHAPDALARARHVYAFGSSQSGRFLRTYLYYGFNADEAGRQVFDGVLAHIAGASRLSINERGATPNGLGMYNATFFPYADGVQRTVGGEDRREGLLDNDRARQHQPKLFYTNSAVEYWGGGRAAALTHVDPRGVDDAVVPENVRIYLLAGTQHSPARFPPRVTTGQQPENPVEYWWTLRALLVGMDRWVREGKEPPASRHPRFADRTIIEAGRIVFPAVPGVAPPHRVIAGRDGRRELPLLVSSLDADGNELAGIRSPEVAAPLATYTGWNFRSAAIGGAGQLVPLMGSAIPFARTAAERKAKGDPRRSVEERYASREEYLKRFREAADQLVAGRYLLPDDIAEVMKRGEAQWQAATGR